MAMDLLSLQPTTLSRDLSGYITYIYGPGKIGKSTFGSQLPSPIFAAFERGYNALPGIIAQDITSWSEMKNMVRELKKPAVKERFKSVIIDTVDIAADLCAKYICSQEGVDEISQLDWGKGWTKVKKEMESTFRTITQLGYAVLFISHDKDKEITRRDNTKYTQTVPSLTRAFNDIVRDMADFYVYAHLVPIGDNQYARKLTIRSEDDSIACGSRFKYIASEIDFSYDAFVQAINDAIDKEVAEKGKEYVTNERIKPIIENELNFDNLMQEFNKIITDISEKATPEEMDNYWAPRITEITDRYLGKGKKVSQCTRDQVEQISLIVTELQDLSNGVE